MNRKGLVIWIVGMLLLGSMAAYLFSQAKKNREELDRQASRNAVMIRDALKKSLSDLRWEIRSFIRYRAVLDVDTVEHSKLALLSKAAGKQDRDKGKFKFNVQSDTMGSVVFSDSITLGHFHFKEICDDLISKNGLDLTKSLTSLKLGKIEKPVPADSLNFFFTIPYKFVVREFATNNTFFDELVLLSENGEVRYPEDMKGIDFKRSLDSISAGFAEGSNEKYEIRLNSTSYRVYLAPLVENDQKIWVLGLKDREDLEKAAYKIDYTILTILGLALLLVLILTPVLSFLSMDKGDVLTQTRVSRIGFSLLVLMLIGGWSCAYFLNLGDPVDKEYGYESLSRNELKSRLDAMAQYIRNDELYNDTQNKSQAPASVKEIFVANKGGTLDHYRIGACMYCDTSHYNYSYISVEHRNYFKYFKTKQNRVFFFVERIFSQLDGNPENIMSLVDSTGNRSVRALSFSLNDLTLDADRRYLLVKKDGEVIHASNKFEIPFTQLQSVLKADDWQVFNTLVTYGKSNEIDDPWDLPLRINGQQYRALISPVKVGNPEQTLWFIYLVDSNVYHLKAGLSSLESLIIVALYLLVVTFFLYLPSFGMRKKYNWKKYSFWWLLFREHKTRNFDGVLIALTVLMVFWIPFMFFNTTSLGQILLYNGLAMILAIAFALYFLRYRSKSTHIGKPHRFQLFVLMWFLCLGFFPGFFISNAVFRMEESIWDNTLKNSNLTTREKQVAEYLSHRSTLFAGTVDLPDDQFKRYVYPRAAVMNSALKNINLGIYKELVKLPIIVQLLVGLLTVLGLILMWKFIRYLTTLLFWTEFKVRETNSLGNIIQSEMSLSKNLRLFLCGCDSHVSRYWIFSQFQLETHQLAIIDCANSGLILPTEAQLADKKALLIEDVHTLDDMRAFMEQIPALLQLATSMHLVFSSGSSWKTLISKMSSETEKVRFSELMSGFYFEFVPLRPNSISVPLHSGDRFDEVEVEQYFFKQGLLNKNEEDPNARLLIQRYGKAFFYNIWVELSLEEQNVCYSYAQEGFLNFKNHDEVVELFQKGVITKNELGGNLQLFSKTFRYFILANISKDRLTEIKDFRKKHSNSGNIQWAIFSFLLIAIALIGYFERSFFTEIQAVVTGISGFITFLVGESKKFLTPKSG